MAWLVWPVSLAAMTRIGRYVPSVLARIGGRDEPYSPVFFAERSGGSGPYLVAVMSRTGR